jgi:hypothetical protein
MAEIAWARVALKDLPDKGTHVEFIAACPPDQRSSFSGSALPFANPKQAFQGTPNKGSVDIENLQEQQAIDLPLASMPNAFYVGLGTVYVPPVVYVRYTSQGRHVTEAFGLSKGVPFRMLTYPSAPATRSREDAMFYAVEEQPVRSQEAILRASAYPLNPAEMPANFWGTRPPL